MDLDRISQYFWGSRYIDELAAKRIDRDPEGEPGWDTSTGIFFFVTDHQFSVVAVVAVLRADGSLYERLTYDAYGNATHRWAIDFNWDGAATSADQTALTIGDIGVSGYVADMDLDRDGDVDTADHTIVGNMLSAWGGSAAALPAGWVCNPADDLGPDSQFGYCGYQFDPEVNHYAVRFRTYDPEIGRWLQRDPIGYADDINLYSYARVTPTRFTDSLGLTAEDPERQRQCGIARRAGRALTNRCPKTARMLGPNHSGISGTVVAAAGADMAAAGAVAIGSKRLLQRSRPVRSVRATGQVPASQYRKAPIGTGVTRAGKVLGKCGTLTALVGVGLDAYDAGYRRGLGDLTGAHISEKSAVASVVLLVAAGSGGVSAAPLIPIGVGVGVSVYVAHGMNDIANYRNDVAASPELNGTCNFLLSQYLQALRRCEGSTVGK